MRRQHTGAFLTLGHESVGSEWGLDERCPALIYFRKINKGWARPDDGSKKSITLSAVRRIENKNTNIR